MKKYDLIIIGGGAGAFAAAIKANQLKKKTLMVNDGLPLGGTCVNVGCVPSKKLLWAAEVAHLAKNHQIRGLDIEVKGINFEELIKEELQLVDSLRSEKYTHVLDNLKNIEYLKGYGSFKTTHSIEVNGTEYAADKFIIATGSAARVPSIENIEEVGYLTHIEALKITKQPKSLTVIGAGAVGLEFAQIYSRLGTKVTILQQADRIFPATEIEISEKLTHILEKEGIQIITEAVATKAETNSDTKTITYTVNNNEKTIEAEEVMIAAGKIPNTKKLNLSIPGVEVNKHAAIIVDEKYATSTEHIYGVGDVVDLPLRLETTAGKEGTLASENALSGTKKTIDYDSVPFTVFTDPQIAGVGLTEESQIEKIGVCACRTVSFDKVPKAIILKRTEGLIKMSIHPETKVIMGVHILGPQAGDLISEAMVLIKNKNTIDDVIEGMPIFPTLSEALKIVAISYYSDISTLSCCI